jgi:hypothetical protein
MVDASSHVPLYSVVKNTQRMGIFVGLGAAHCVDDQRNVVGPQLAPGPLEGLHALDAQGHLRRLRGRDVDLVRRGQEVPVEELTQKGLGARGVVHSSAPVPCMLAQGA